MSPSNPELPWHNRPSIFAHINSHVDEQGRLTKEGIKLPDDEIRFQDEPLRFVAGGMDGVFGHHVGEGESEAEARQIAEWIKSIAEEDTIEPKMELYEKLQEDKLVGLIDPVLNKMVEFALPIQPYLHNYARWLAFDSPDRGAVKFGIAILGLIRDPQDMPDILTLGKHEEFTLFASVALTNSDENPEMQLWQLAQFVDGWGKIQIVERLADTQHPEIKKWLVREGYKNSIMYEYLAYVCAEGGELKKELSAPDIDDELLRGAGDIIEALVNGGPAQDIRTYQDGSEVFRLYIGHLKKAGKYQLRDFLVLRTMQRFIQNEERDWTWLEKMGWTEDARNNLLIEIHQLIKKDLWRELVLKAQSSKDETELWWANSVARAIGMDMWEIHWKRLRDNPRQSVLWYHVTEDLNEERMDKIIALAKAQLPMDEIAAGPADELGMGPAFEAHRSLDFVLQYLGKYPGKGGDLIKTALRSPVTRNRNMALKVLSEWGQGHWPADMEAFLVRAFEQEPSEDTREKMAMVLNGDKMD